MPTTKKKQPTVKKPTTTTNKKPPTPSSTKDKRRSPRTPTTTSSATRNKPKRVTTRGGELLGQGVYGCAFSPQIPCSASKLKGAVSKLMTWYAANDEAGKASLATSMDPDGKYLLPFVGMCDTDAKLVNDYLANHPGDDCTTLNTVILKNNPHLLVYKHKGIDLKKYLELSKLMPLKDMVKHLLNVAEGIKLLQVNQSAHTDIKPDNVLLVDLEDGQKRMLLMDFGLLEDLDTIYENDGKLKHNSDHYPPELLVYYVLNWEEKQPKAQELYNLLFSENANYASDTKHYKERNGIWIEWIDNYQQNLETFFTQLYQFMKADKGTEKEKAKNLQRHFTDNFAKKMDVFQFGFVLQEVVSYYKPSVHGPESSIYKFEKGDEERFNDLKKVLKNTYHSNPYARWDIDTVITELEKMVNKSYSTVAKSQSTSPKSPSSPAATKKPPSLSPPPPAKAAKTLEAPEKKSGETARNFLNNNSLKIIKGIITGNKMQPRTAGNKGANTVVGSKKPTSATTTKRTPRTSARAAATKKK